MSAAKYPEYISKPSEIRMADDFRLFLWFLWKALSLPEPTPIQYAIADWLQHGPRRRIVMAFRGVGKSWITAAFVLWCLWRNPEERILVVSASKERADAFSIFVKRLINEVPLLSVLQPREGQRTSNIAFDVGPSSAAQAPSVKSVGITGQMAGSRATKIIPDDIEIPSNSATEAQREKLNDLSKEFDAVLVPNGQIIVLGTPQTGESIYGVKYMQARGYVARVWPARYTTGIDGDGKDHYHGALAPELTTAMEENPSLLGRSTEPTRFSDLDLAEREASYGKSGFALQFMLDTSLSDADRFPLKMRDLIIMDVDKQRAPTALTWASGKQQQIEGLPNVGFNGDRFHSPLYVSTDFQPYQGSVMFIDPSGRGKDETSYAVVKMLNGWLYVTRWGGIAGGYSEETLTALALIAKEQNVNEVWPEENFGDGMFTALFAPILRRHHQCSLPEEPFRVSGQKERRIIQKLEPILNQHRLVIDRRVIEDDHKSTEGRVNYSGMYQLTHLTADRGSLKHDDRVDVLAEAVGYWTEKIGNDTAKAEAERKTKLQDEELKKFMKSVLGRDHKKRSFIRW